MSDRIIVHVGDRIRRGPHEEAIVAWIGPTNEDVRLISLSMPKGLGGWVGTAYVKEVLVYEGFNEDTEHYEYSLLNDWAVSKALWGKND